MDKQINILVYPGGSENALEIHLALKDIVNISLFGVSGRKDHGEFVFKNYKSDFPFINNVNFIEVLNEYITENKIDILIPTHDDVVLFLAENEKQINTKILIPGLDQARVCRSKKLTFELFQNDSFCPKVFDNIHSITRFPVFAKPDTGQGGNGTIMIEHKDISLITEAFLKDFVINEYLPGDELTVDCFSDKDNELRFTGPRKRERVFSGISVNSFAVKLTEEVEQIAKTINSKMKMNGLWYFQLRQDIDGKYKLLEVSIRVSGTMNLFRGLGVNFPLLSVYNALGYNVSIMPNEFQLEVDRAFVNRYKHDIEYDTIYLDFDDTITKNGVVNPQVMMFVYNAINNQKSIKLITRHEFNIHETLKRLGISEQLFSEIIQIKADEKKYLFITEKEKIIFIDNAYFERAEVKKHLNIPVFDVDAITTLINWKE